MAARKVVRKTYKMNLEKLYDLSGPCGLVIVLIGIVAVYLSVLEITFIQALPEEL